MLCLSITDFINGVLPTHVQHHSHSVTLCQDEMPHAYSTRKELMSSRTSQSGQKLTSKQTQSTSSKHMNIDCQLQKQQWNDNTIVKAQNILATWTHMPFD